MIRVKYFIETRDDDGTKEYLISTVEIKMDTKRQEEEEFKIFKTRLGDRFISSTHY